MGSEFWLSLWSFMTLCCSYSRTVRSAKHLILLYDFLPQGEGGRLPVSCAVLLNLNAAVLNTTAFMNFFVWLMFGFFYLQIWCTPPLPDFYYFNKKSDFLKSHIGVLLIMSVIIANDVVPFQFLLHWSAASWQLDAPAGVSFLLGRYPDSITS